MNSFSPKQISIFLHFLILVFFLLITSLHQKNAPDIMVPIVYQAPAEAMNLKEINKETKIAIKSVNKVENINPKTREVFGLNRNSYTDNSGSSTGIAVKLGNTVAKATDKEILKNTDSDSLPTPTDEYLVSQMPRVIAEVKPIYPKEARDKQKEGSVALNVLIDDKGNVRSVEMVQGDDIFKVEAVEAMKKFKFSPANINGKAVAVKIRYVIKFKLEY